MKYGHNELTAEKVTNKSNSKHLDCQEYSLNATQPIWFEDRTVYNFGYF